MSRQNIQATKDAFMTDDPKVSIIIPFFNRWDLTHARLMELYKFAPEYCEIILIDDASTEEAEINGGIAWWQNNTDRHTIRYHLNPENVGFGLSHNNGARMAKGKYLILLSNDVVMNANFVDDMIGLIGDSDKMLVAGRVVDWAGGWNELDINGRHYVIPYAEGWLIGCTKVGWKGLGGFDPLYGKFDYEDIDLTVTALSLGYNIANLHSTKVKHISGATIYRLYPDREEITKRNRELFITKWREKIPFFMK